MPGTILFVASNPTATKFDFKGELTAIRAAASRRRHSKLNLVARWSIDAASLRDAVSKFRPDIVHLVSPGVDVGTHGLVLSTADGRPEYVKPEVIGGAFAGAGARAAPHLVVLNTCHSYLHARAIAEHVGCVIAMNGIIYDNVAVAFARQLYDALSFGETVLSAFEQARSVVAVMDRARADVPVLLPGRVNPEKLTFAEVVRGRPAPAMRGAMQAAPAVAPCSKLFCSYSHKDEKYRAELETHLALLSRQGAVHLWHDRKIQPGQNWKDEIDDNINHADLVLLLVSADFVASEYCYGIEAKRALDRAAAGETRVVPILVRKCDLEGIPFEKLHWLPTGSKPVKNWSDRDSAWADVAAGIRKVVRPPAAGGAALTR